MEDKYINAYIEGDNSDINMKFKEGVENGTFNLAAGLLGAPYYFYRKCYGKGILIFFMNILISIVTFLILSSLMYFTSGSNLTFVNYIASSLLDSTMPLNISTSISAGIGVLLYGTMFYPAYRKKMKYVVQESKKNIEVIKELGGVDRVSALIMTLLLVLTSAMLIATIIHF